MGLGRIQRDAELVIFSGNRGAQVISRRVIDRHGTASFSGTANGCAVFRDIINGSGVRRRSVHNDSRRCSHVAHVSGFVDLFDGKGMFAIA